MVSAQDVADYIIWSSHESGSFISNLKLQKLLYYVQAWHLAVFQRPLFPEKFQAWLRGPAIPEIYERYQGYRWRNIDEEVKPPDLDARTVAFIEEVLEEYGPLDARLLEQLACREEPWIQARGGIAVDEPSTATIDEKVMELCYRQRLSDAELRDMLQEEERETGEGAEVRQPVNGGDSTAAVFSQGHEMISGSGEGNLAKGQPRPGRSAGVKFVARGKLRGKFQGEQRVPKPIKVTLPSDILDPLLRFSFKFLDLDHAVFHCKDRQPGYYHRLLERMKDLSGRRVNELTNAGTNSAIRFHRIDWENDRVSVKSFGIRGWERFDEDAWQFSISANEHGRVHGFLYVGVFYIVWLDPEHRLYPGKA